MERTRSFRAWTSQDGRGWSSAAPAMPRSAARAAEDTADRLRRVDKLLEQGLVTADEHRDLRKKIIDSI